jgi:hypothetical protein
MVLIRPYKATDFPLVKSWWNAANEVAPLPEMMPEDSSFITEIDGRPVLAVTVYLTNSKAIAYTENFIGDPEYKGSSRREAASMLSDHIATFAKERGYQNLLCIASTQKLVGRYEELGYVKTLENVSTFVRRL